MLDSDSDDIRIKAAWALGVTKTQKTGLLLCSKLQDPSILSNIAHFKTVLGVLINIKHWKVLPILVNIYDQDNVDIEIKKLIETSIKKISDTPLWVFKKIPIKLTNDQKKIIKSILEKARSPKQILFESLEILEAPSASLDQKLNSVDSIVKLGTSEAVKALMRIIDSDNNLKDDEWKMIQEKAIIGLGKFNKEGTF